MPDTPNGWNEWSRHILAEIDRLSEGDEKRTAEISRLREDFSRFRAEVMASLAGLRTEVKVRSSVNGLLFGGGISILVLVLRALMG